MLAIEFRFLGGRYHSTPWDHHVNEGIPEWPPSPWRILRALIATWHLKAQEDIPRQQIMRLVEKLASTPPRYHLPIGTMAHTRHYMPLYKGTPTKILDSFIHLPVNAVLSVCWPTLDLPTPDQKALSVLLDRINYFGRAESWAEARLGDISRTPSPNSLPAEADSGDTNLSDRVPVLVPIASADYSAWRHSFLEEQGARLLVEKERKNQRRGKRTKSAKLTNADQRRLDQTVPADLFSALQTDTGVLRKHGWNRPPGSQWLDYLLPRFTVSSTPSALPRNRGRPLPTVARLALASQALPRLTETVSVADRIRTALLSRSDAADVFLGRDAEGHPLQNHRHAFILPEANHRHGRITHATIYAPMGLDRQARQAIDGLQKVWGHGGHDIQIVLLGIGAPEDFVGTNLTAGQCPLFLTTDVWVSRTPFIPTRHAKTYHDGRQKLDESGLQIGSPEHDLRRLLKENDFPEVVCLERLDKTELGGKSTRWLAFRTLRSNGKGRRASKVGQGFRITLTEPVRGPVSLGYGAHFGLGLFVPDGLY